MTQGTHSVAEVVEAVVSLLQHRPSAVLSDFDGTLSPVAATPDAAVPAPGVPELLRQLATQVDVVGIITGRGIADAHPRMGVDEILYVGNHGLESLKGGEHHVHPAGMQAMKVLPEALRDIELRLRAHVSLEGVIFEDKVYSASIHYRVAPDPGAVRTALEPIIRDIADDYGFWVSDGKMVFELRAGATVNKGTAVRQIIHDDRLQAAIFLGDDVTDADAFRVLHELRRESSIHTLAIGVLTLDTDPRVVESSDYLLGSVDDVVEMLLQVSTQLAAKGREA